MKILLINPSKFKISGPVISYNYSPLGLAYIGAVLEKVSHDVKIIDIDADRISENKFLKIIKNEYEIIGVTATTPTYKEAERLCKLIKENSKAITVLGGIHTTILPENCASSEYIDFVVRGEGEKTILELVSAIGNNTNYERICGISFKKNGKIFHSPDRKMIEDIDTIPFPARHLLSHKAFTYPGSLATPAMPIITSRGCPYNCSYCCAKLMFTRNVRLRSAKNVVDEIEELVNRYKVKEIDIFDDNYTVSKERVIEIKDELKHRDINLKFAFPNLLRADQVDKEILLCLKEMGVYNVGFGAESGNQAILDSVNKGITLAQIKQAYSLAKGMRFETYGSFMIGFPGETIETIQDTIKFAKKIDPDIATFHIMKPYPGTDVFNKLMAKGLITNFDYTKYGLNTGPVHKLPGLTENDLLTMWLTAQREFYLRPFKIVRIILNIGSWARLKLLLKNKLRILNFIRYLIFGS